MLLTFKVKNFKSFGKELQTFSLVAGKQSKHEEHLIKTKDKNILKFSAMYGANASGKSNFIKALDFLKNNIKKEDYIKTCPNFANKMLPTEENSYFEVELAIDNELFSYGLEVNFEKREIISEWLIDYTNKDKAKKIFERSGDKIESEIDFNGDKKIEDMFKVFMEEYEKNTTDSFLRYIFLKPMFSLSEIKDIQNILMVYLMIGLIDITYPNRDNIGFQSFIIEKEKLENILSEFSTGISKVEFKSISQSEFLSKIPKENSVNSFIEANIKKFVEANSMYNKIEKNIENEMSIFVEKLVKEQIKNIIFFVDDYLFFLTYEKTDEGKCKYNEITFNHNGVMFNYGLESDGTKRLVQLLSILLDNTQDKTFFIDEIDRSLHPLLSRKFIELFFELKKEHKQQLIITTHESRLLDFNLIRQDEIWFAEKNKLGCTELFSLEDFGERNDRKLDKAYLDGRYGAIPAFANDFFDTSDVEEDKI